MLWQIAPNDFSSRAPTLNYLGKNYCKISFFIKSNHTLSIQNAELEEGTQLPPFLRDTGGAYTSPCTPRDVAYNYELQLNSKYLQVILEVQLEKSLLGK